MNKILRLNDLTFEVIDAGEFLKLALLPDMAEKYKNSDCGQSFAKVMGEYAQEVASLPLSYLKKPVFGFVVLPQGKIFQSLSNCPFPKGMCGIKAQMDDTFVRSLAVDEIWFEQGFSEVPTSEQKIGLIHELSHIIHGAYFQRMGCLGEGFAELLPHYLMKVDNAKHDALIKTIDIDKLPVLGFLNQNGMFANPEDKKLRAQYRTSYLSAYLWMFAYIKRIEKKYGLDKFAATHFFLTHFAELDKMSWHEKMEGVAGLISLSESECFGELILQREASAKYFEE